MRRAVAGVGAAALSVAVAVAVAMVMAVAVADPVTGSRPAMPGRPASSATPPVTSRAQPNEVTIRLLVEPPGIAHVLWGVKDLGVAPLDIVRPRASGPLDLTLRAPSYLTFHTRAFTDHDDKIAIRMVLAGAAARLPGFAGAEISGPEAERPSVPAAPRARDPARAEAHPELNPDAR